MNASEAGGNPTKPEGQLQPHCHSKARSPAEHVNVKWHIVYHLWNHTLLLNEFDVACCVDSL